MRTIIVPSKKLVIISLLLLLFVLPDFIFENLNIIENNKFLTVKEVNLNTIYHEKIVKLNYLVITKLILTFNFFRLSELQELIIVYYFFWHSIFLYKKIIEKY